MELQQLGNLVDVLGGEFRDNEQVRVVIPGPIPIAVGIMSISWSQEEGCFFMVLDEEDEVEL